jgi:hypothetical protein
MKPVVLRMAQPYPGYDRCLWSNTSHYIIVPNLHYIFAYVIVNMGVFQIKSILWILRTNDQRETTGVRTDFLLSCQLIYPLPKESNDFASGTVATLQTN